jgi:glycosyltransferase involved in cell wall biosynthesis
MDCILAVSIEDRNVLTEFAPDVAIRVAPNGVDLEHFVSGPPANDPVAVFVGKLDYRPNVDAVLWFVREILPLVRVKVPDFRALIVGSSPSPAVRSACQEPGVEIHTNVPDVRPHLRSAAMAVVPIRAGSGTRLKVLEAMASGLPVVSTSIGCEGIRATRERDIIVADDARSLAQAMIELCRDSSRRQRIGTKGRRLVEEQYSWERSIQVVSEAHLEVAERLRR